MRTYKIISQILLLACGFCACKRETITPTALSSFTVTADSTAASSDTAYYHLGSKTAFNFTGNPMTITFYSGEIGHRYIYRNRMTAMGTPRFIFTNALNLGSQPNTLHVMVSTNFKGVVPTSNDSTVANIAAASWDDVTPVKLATNATAVTDTIDLTSYTKAGLPVYIAFKYTAQAGALQNKWTITNVNLTNTLADNSVYTIANLNATTTAILNYGASTFSPGWVAYTPSNTKKWAISASNLVIDSTTAASTTNSESWTLMGNIDITKVTPDMGVAIKNISGLPATYRYGYAAVGVYNATVVATNNSVYTQDSVVKVVPVVVQ
jgi:hypothetical protein